MDGNDEIWDHEMARGGPGRGFDAGRFLDQVERNDIGSGDRIMLNREELSGLEPCETLDEFLFIPDL